MGSDFVNRIVTPTTHVSLPALSPRLSVRGPGVLKSEPSLGCGGRESLRPAQAKVWPAALGAIDPTRRRPSDSRNTPRLPGRIEISGVEILREKVFFSSALPTCD